MKKKLILQRETILPLNNDELDAVNGGGTTTCTSTGPSVPTITHYPTSRPGPSLPPPYTSRVSFPSVPWTSRAL